MCKPGGTYGKDEAWGAGGGGGEGFKLERNVADRKRGEECGRGVRHRGTVRGRLGSKSRMRNGQRNLWFLARRRIRKGQRAWPKRSFNLWTETRSTISSPRLADEPSRHFVHTNTDGSNIGGGSSPKSPLSETVRALIDGRFKIWRIRRRSYIIDSRADPAGS